MQYYNTFFLPLKWFSISDEWFRIITLVSRNSHTAPNKNICEYRTFDYWIYKKNEKIRSQVMSRWRNEFGPVLPLHRPKCATCCALSNSSSGGPQPPPPFHPPRSSDVRVYSIYKCICVFYQMTVYVCRLLVAVVWPYCVIMAKSGSTNSVAATADARPNVLHHAGRMQGFSLSQFFCMFSLFFIAIISRWRFARSWTLGFIRVWCAPCSWAAGFTAQQIASWLWAYCKLQSEFFHSATCIFCGFAY